VILDDLELRCGIVRSVSVPVKSSGSTTSFGGFAIDLDNGTVRAAPAIGSDLTWDPLRGFRALGPVRLAVTGSSWGSLTPVQVSRLPMSTVLIPAALVPWSMDPGFPFFFHDDVVFGARTSEGRYAKVRAWRSLTEGGAVKVEWVTWATPVPQLDLTTHWSVLERGEIDEYITRDCQFCRSAPVRQCVLIEAWPRLMAFPIDLQWCVCGHILEEGEGEIRSPSGPLSYKLDGRQLWIETDMGQSVDCEVCVSAIDRRGMELFSCVQLSQSGIEKRCRACSDRSKDYRIDFIPAAAAVRAWQPLLKAAAVRPEEVEMAIR